MASILPPRLPPGPNPAGDAAAPSSDGAWYQRLVALFFVVAIAAPGIAVLLHLGGGTLEHEKRALAVWPSLGQLARTPTRFAGEFEKAFVDRFGGRDALIALHHAALVSIFGVSPVPDVILGREGWLFLAEDEPGVRNRSGEPDYLKSRARAVAKGIEYRIAILGKQGIDYLLVVVPEKRSVYPEYFPHPNDLKNEERLASVLAALPPALRSHVLDLRPALLDGRKDRQVFFRTDTHWNMNGAWIGYEQILSYLRHDPAQIARPPWPSEIANGMTSGDLARMLGSGYRAVEPVPGHSKVSVCARGAGGNFPEWGASKQTLHCPQAPFGTAFVYHDSMGFALLPLLPNTFRASFWNYQRAWDLHEIAAASPEIVIDMVVVRSLIQLADAWFLESALPVSDAPSGSGMWIENSPRPRTADLRLSGSCTLDYVNGHVTRPAIAVRDGDRFDLRGAVRDLGNAGVPEAAWFVLRNEKKTYRLRVTVELPQADTSSPGRQPMSAGYRFRANAENEPTPLGNFVASILWVDAAGWTSCELPARIKSS